METTDGNKLIAEFMGYKILYDGNIPHAQFLRGETEPISDWAKYHSSWDWLMPVVEKIDTFERFSSEDNGKRKCVTNCGITTDIETIWMLIIEYIQWYNTQSK